MISIFADIPLHLQICLVSEWIDLSSLTRLDSANCGRTRLDFLALLRRSYLNLNVADFKNPRFVKVIEWVVEKGLHLTSVTLRRDCSEVALRLLLLNGNNGCRLIRDETKICLDLAFFRTNNTIQELISQLCVNHISRIVDIKEDGHCLQSLSFFQVQLSTMAHLKTLHLSFDLYLEMPQTVFSYVFIKCPTIECLIINSYYEVHWSHGDDDDALQLPEHCVLHHLTSLSLSIRNRFPVMALCSRCPNLVKLSVRGTPLRWRDLLHLTMTLPRVTELCVAADVDTDLFDIAVNQSVTRFSLYNANKRKIEDLCRRLPNLTALTLQCETDNDDIDALFKCITCTTLSLSRLEVVLDPFESTLTDLHFADSSLKASLRHFVMSGPRVTLSALETLLQDCRRLTCVDFTNMAALIVPVSRNAHVSGDGVQELRAKFSKTCILLPPIVTQVSADLNFQNND